MNALVGIDACKIGLCDFYDDGSGVFGLIAGVVLGVALILVIQRLKRRRKD